MISLYHDPARRLLVYDAPAAFIPDAKRVNGYTFVPASLRNVQLLRQQDYPVIPIMEQDGYDWPIERGRKPLAHQKLMANFLVSHPKSFNLSDMGTMKTLSTLWAADYLMQQAKGQCRALIVAPLSTLRSVWGSAIFANFLNRRVFRIIHGSAKERSAELAKAADFYVINFDGVGIGATKNLQLDRLSRELYDRTDIRIVVVDEASAYRDSRTKRHRIARQVFGNRDYLWLLTGTPTPNGPTDAYGLARLVNNAKGESFTSFHTRTMIQVSKFVWKPRVGAYDEARKLLTPSIRFDIRDVWDGPEMTTQQREVDLTDAQRKSMHQLKRELRIELRDGRLVNVANEAASRQKFLQISLGAVYDADHHGHPIDASTRLKVLREIISTAPGKILLFAPLTSVIDLLYRELKNEIPCGIVNGQTGARDRASLFERFQRAESDLRMLIADPGTMAHGLDLSQARTVVWYGPSDRTELYLQANRRAWRPGQRYPVTIVQVVSNKLEKEIFHRLEHNESLQGLLLQMVRDDTL